MLYPNATRGARRITRILGAAAIATTLLGAAPAWAQSLCLPHGDMSKRLGDGYAEKTVALGLASNGGVVELFSSNKGASWTITITMPNGTTCPVLSGEGWESLPQVALGPQV